ncbi:MAG: type secretion system-associated domain protein TagH [Pseudomonadota bacterium]|jgi:type VI secretion system protein ImpI/type VI secretion system protein
MSLSLKVISYKGLPLVEAIQAEIGHQGGTIGRRIGNSLVLPDNENIVSGKHAEIVYQNGVYLLKDTSTNGTFLIHANVGLNNNEAILQSNELLQIGEYQVSVFITAEFSENITPASERAFDTVSSFFSETNQSAPRFDFDDVKPFFSDDSSLDDSFSSGASALSGVPIFQDQPPSSPFNDSFTPPDVISADEADQDISAFLKGLDALTPGGLTTQVQHPFNSINDSEKSTELAFQNDLPESSFPQTPSVSLSADQQSATEDYLKSLSALSEERFSVASVKTDTSNATPIGVNPSISHQPLGHSQAIQTPVPSANDESELIKSFLQGAGIADSNFIPIDSWPETMATVGSLFRLFTEGMMDVLRVRAEMKSQFRVSMTTIRIMDNNPLKFNPDVESVLKLMLTPKNPAFISSEEAVKEGFRDIKLHQLAMTAGIQASLSEIMNRFNPETIENSLGEGLIFQKKSRYWEYYCDKYPALKSSALEEFFSDAFVEAYEKQMKLFDKH